MMPSIWASVGMGVVIIVTNVPVCGQVIVSMPSIRMLVATINMSVSTVAVFMAVVSVGMAVVPDTMMVILHHVILGCP